jgi:CHAD domain-containing protein
VEPKLTFVFRPVKAGPLGCGSTSADPTRLEHSAPATDGGSPPPARQVECTLKLVSELASASRVGRTNLHSYRLKVKEVRNLLGMADRGGDEFMKQLGELKDAIGQWHDWDELIAIAEDVLDHGAQYQLIRELERSRDAKYKKAPALFHATRKKYLRQFDQRKPRQSIPSPEEDCGVGIICHRRIAA